MTHSLGIARVETQATAKRLSRKSLGIVAVEDNESASLKLPEYTAFHTRLDSYRLATLSSDPVSKDELTILAAIDSSYYTL